MADIQNMPLIRINLLPPERRRVSFDWLPKAVAMSLFVLAVGSALAVNFHYAWRAMQLRGQKSKIESKIASIQPDVNRVRAMEDEIQVLHKKEAVINELVVGRIEWARKLNQLSDILPPRIWLEKVSLDTEKPSGGRNAGPARKVLRIVGVTRALEHARSLEAAFIYNIMHSPFMDDFETVQLMDSSLTEWQGDRKVTVWRFQLQLPLKSKKQTPDAPPSNTDSKRKSSPEGGRV